ncbi:MAG TPA: hypothetical protein VGE72_03090 [Azospirillum sp.]
MIDGDLLCRYRTVFGNTFNALLWDKRPEDTINRMMRDALKGQGPLPTDGRIAAVLATRIGHPANDA